MSVGDWIGRLDRWMAANRGELYAALAPGASEAELAAAQAKHGAFPEGVAELFAWRQGPHSGVGRFQANYSLMSLADAVGTKEMLDAMLASGELEREGWWTPTWLPFLENGGGDHVCVDLDNGEIVEFWHDEEWRGAKYRDMVAWLEVFVRSLEGGVWKLDEQYGFFEANDAALRALVSEVSPGYPIDRNAGPRVKTKPAAKTATKKTTTKSKPAKKKTKSKAAKTKPAKKAKTKPAKKKPAKKAKTRR